MIYDFTKDNKRNFSPLIVSLNKTLQRALCLIEEF